MAGGNISVYDAPGNGLDTNSAVSNAYEGTARTQAIALSSAGSDIGRGIGALGGAAQQVYDERVAQPEISKGGPLLATINDNLSSTLDEMEKSTDPNDDSFVGKFREEKLEPELEKFIGGFTTDKGRLWAENMADRLRQHYYERTAADASSRAKVAVGQNIEVMTNLFAASAKDPHSIDLALGTLDPTIHELVTNSALSGTDAATAETTILQQSRAQIVATGLSNMAMANPNEFLRAFQAGEFDRYQGDLPSSAWDQIENGAKALVKARESDDKAALTAQVKAEDEAADAYSVKLMTDALGGDPDALTRAATEFAQMPGTQRRPETLRATINAIQTFRDDAAKGYVPPGTPEVFSDLMNRANLPANDPRRLTNTDLQLAVAKRAINKNQYDQISPVLNATDEGVKFDNQYFNTEIDQTWKPLLTRSVATGQYSDSTSIPPGASVALAQFRFDMQARFNYGRSQGISARELLDPSSGKSIFGKNGVNVQPYIAMAQKWKPGVIPVLPVIPNLQGTAPQAGDLPSVSFAREGVTDLTVDPDLANYADFFSGTISPDQLKSINEQAAKILGGQ